MQPLFFFFVLSSKVLCCSASSQDAKQYTAAVYEHTAIFFPFQSPPPRAKAIQIMMTNLKVYEQKAIEAASKGAQIIVFPEDGIYGMGYTRDRIRPFLEAVPEVRHDKPWNPCRQPKDYVEVLQFLSCMAFNNSIAVVANMGDIQYCDEKDRHCPEDGHYQFNTDVVFDTDGTFIAKYHKQNLFHETAFDTPPSCEYVTFVTSFNVTFGIFTCFDLLFEKPAMALVEKYGVRNVVFPTAWMKGFPILHSVQYQQSWSRVTCVNLLAANQNQPALGMWGSGIYSSGQPLAYVYKSRIEENERLLIATLQDRASETEIQVHSKKKITRILPLEVREKRQVKAKIMDDWYSVVKLESPKGNRIVCHGVFCCKLEYELQENYGSELYALGAFQGPHQTDKYFLEVCVLLKCSSTDISSCGIPVVTAKTVFQSLKISGSFSPSTTVFPELLGGGTEVLFDAVDMVTSGHCEMEVRGFGERPLVSATLLGRDFTRDA
ncbi:predicted protein [Nematostella vectensis]|uniref:CN hydrolase domain-containing protein n=1 Tax=Nematostella vectensis TaxID=45351 RepID=A7SCZ4_NEMVE|nr:predicted protein [Nematostella vectensis]|eukprot:XP_001630467.1 predicted protein [Nematostella vectensis]